LNNNQRELNICPYQVQTFQLPESAKAGQALDAVLMALSLAYFYNGCKFDIWQLYLELAY
jgi:hypothetical protein